MLSLLLYYWPLYCIAEEIIIPIAIIIEPITIPTAIFPSSTTLWVIENLVTISININATKIEPILTYYKR